MYDQDATIGPNKLFKDLATGLASRGLAVYRYTRRQPTELSGPVTPDTLYVEDAVNAVDRVEDLEEVRDNNVYVAGHSLGGILAPRIAAEHGGTAGLILLDALGLSYGEQIRRFGEAILAREFNTEAEERRARTLKRIGTEIQNGELPNRDPLLGLGTDWVTAMVEYNQISTAAELGIPLFGIHGGRGPAKGAIKQESLDNWHSGVATDGSEFRMYEALNHQLQPGTLPSVQAEARLFHDSVSEQLINDIQHWITTRA